MSPPHQLLAPSPHNLINRWNYDVGIVATNDVNVCKTFRLILSKFETGGTKRTTRPHKLIFLLAIWGNNTDSFRCGNLLCNKNCCPDDPWNRTQLLRQSRLFLDRDVWTVMPLCWMSRSNDTQTCILWNKTKVYSYNIFSATITTQFPTTAEDPATNSTSYRFGSCFIWFALVCKPNSGSLSWPVQQHCHNGGTSEHKCLLSV
jgi:hypothetical protein